MKQLFIDDLVKKGFFEQYLKEDRVTVRRVTRDYILSALINIKDGRLKAATNDLNQAREIQYSSKIYPPTKFVTGNKEIFQFHKDMQLFKIEKGIWPLNIIIKQFSKDQKGMDPKIKLLAKFWNTYDKFVKNSNDPNVPQGEQISYTNQHLISKFFTQGNLFYDHLFKKPNNKLLDNVIKTYMKFNNFVNDFIRLKRKTVVLERLERSIINHPELLEALREEKNNMQELIDSAPYSAYTDPKTANIILDNNTTYIVDADKISDKVTKAYNWSHLVFDPAWKLKPFERINIFRENSYFKNQNMYYIKNRSSTLLSAFCFLTEQVYFMEKGPRVFINEWLPAEKKRYETFLENLNYIIDHKELPKFSLVKEVKKDLKNKVINWY